MHTRLRHEAGALPCPGRAGTSTQPILRHVPYREGQVPRRPPSGEPAGIRCRSAQLRHLLFLATIVRSQYCLRHSVPLASPLKESLEVATAHHEELLLPRRPHEPPRVLRRLSIGCAPSTLSPSPRRLISLRHQHLLRGTSLLLEDSPGAARGLGVRHQDRQCLRSPWPRLRAGLKRRPRRSDPNV